MDNLQLALMCGIDIAVPELKVSIHQPTIKEIAYLGENNFFQAVQCLLVDKKMIEQDKIISGDINNFQIFMTIIQTQNENTKDKKQHVINLLSMLFQNAKISITPVSIFCIYKDNEFIIDEGNFNIIQNYLKQIFCFDKKKEDESSFNPANEKAKEIAEKIMRGRKKVAELKSQDSNSIFSQYLSSLAVGLSSMSLNDLMNLTMYQIYDLIERYSLYMNWDIDIRSRLAGATPDDKPENWMKNIH